MRYLHIMMYIQTYYAKDTSKNSPVSLAGFHSGKHSCSATIMPWKMQMVALCIELPKLPQTKGRSSKARVRTVTTGPVWHIPFRRGECLHYEPSLWALVIDIIDSDKNPFQFLWVEGSVWFYRVRGKEHLALCWSWCGAAGGAGGRPGEGGYYLGVLSSLTVTVLHDTGDAT